MKGEKEKTEVSIETLLVWAYREQRVASAHMAGVGGNAGTMTGAVASIGRLGAVVSGGGGSSWVGELDAHPDARVVHRIVQALEPADLVRLVQRPAELGVHPGGLAFARPEILPAKQPRFAYDPDWECGRKPWACLLEVRPMIENVIAHRAIYGEWREALALLSRQFRARPWLLSRHRVTAALPPALPPAEKWWTVKRRMIENPQLRAAAERDWRQRRFQKRQAQRRRDLMTKALDESPQKG